MEQRFFFRGTSSLNSASRAIGNDYSRRLLGGSSSVIRVGLARQLLQDTAPPASPPPPPPAPPTATKFGSLDPNVVIIMVVLLFALICAAFINTFMRFVLRRRAQNARAVFLARNEGTGDNSSEHGLDAKTLASLPVLTFKASHSSKNMELDCAICLSEFTEDDRLRLLPNCKHVFHLDCIDMWLLSHVSCPVCRDAITDLSVGQANAAADPAGSQIFLTRDHAGNASARISTGSEIGGTIVKGEGLDGRVELLRDASWNSFSESRGLGSRRLSRGEGSMDRLGSSRRSFRSQIAAMLTSDKTLSGRWLASSSAATAAPPPAPAGSPSESDGISLTANDLLAQAADDKPGQLFTNDIPMSTLKDSSQTNLQH